MRLARTAHSDVSARTGKSTVEFSLRVVHMVTAALRRWCFDASHVVSGLLDLAADCRGFQQIFRLRLRMQYGANLLEILEARHLEPLMLTTSLHSLHAVHQLDLVELVAAEQASGVAARRPRFPAEARRVGGEPHRQPDVVEDLAGGHRREGDLGRGDRPQVVALDVGLVVVALGLGRVTGTWPQGVPPAARPRQLTAVWRRVVIRASASARLPMGVPVRTRS